MTTSKPSAPTPPRPPPSPLSVSERWYFDCFTLWAKHYGRSPSIRELALYCSRGHTATGIALEKLAHKGWLVRKPGATRGRADGLYALIEVAS